MALTIDIEGIVQRRKVRNWTQQQLADAAKVSKKSIERLEQGRSKSLDLLDAIASVFGIRRAELQIRGEIALPGESSQDLRLLPYLTALCREYEPLFYGNLADTYTEITVKMPELFVAPTLSTRLISPEFSPSERGTVFGLAELFNTLFNDQWVAILGEPGAGKSILLTWLAWKIAKGEYPDHRFSNRIPVFIALRELSLGLSFSWNDILDQFPNTTLGKKLISIDDWKPAKEAVLAGHAILILDGIDELPRSLQRQALRIAIAEHVAKTSNLVIVGSRVAGYDEGKARHVEEESDFGIDIRDKKKRKSNVKSIALLKSTSEVTKLDASKLFLVPFDDLQIQQFAINWYRQRCSFNVDSVEQAADFVGALHRNRDVLNLARVPNLLTLMALVHRQGAVLPDGRVAVYEKLVGAYLDRIDNFRKVQTRKDSLLDKKRWLGSVALEMQARRKNVVSTLLLEKNDLRNILKEVMAMPGEEESGSEVSSFIRYLDERTGLLVERAPLKYGWLHLTVMEYLAGWMLTRAAFEFRNNPLKDVRARMDDELWLETLVFYLGIMKEEAGREFEVLIDELFGTEWRNGYPNNLKNITAIVLLARVARDPRGGFTEKNRDRALLSCIRWEIEHHLHYFARPVLVAIFGGDREQEPAMHKLLREVWPNTQTSLNLSYTGITDVSQLPSCLKHLDISYTGVTDLSKLPIGLTSLNASHTSVADLASLPNNLKELNISSTDVKDVSQIPPSVIELNVSDTKITDFTKLSTQVKIVGFFQ